MHELKNAGEQVNIRFLSNLLSYLLNTVCHAHETQRNVHESILRITDVEILLLLKKEQVDSTVIFNADIVVFLRFSLCDSSAVFNSSVILLADIAVFNSSSILSIF